MSSIAVLLTASRWTNQMDTVSRPADCAAYSIPEVMARVGVGRDKLYCLIREGRLPARKLGRKTLILASDLEAFLEALPRLGAAS
jgi:excisionase family DNA binding protein